MIFATIVAWVVGLLLDTNLGFQPDGFLELRLLLPMIVIGRFILKRLDKKDQ